MYTQQQIRNYIPKGEQIEIIKQTPEGACIVEWKGQRYPCRIELLGAEPPKDDIVIEEGLL